MDERKALRALFHLARATSPDPGASDLRGAQGGVAFNPDVYVGCERREGAVRLEAWAREIDALRAETSLPPRLRADTETLAFELGGRLEVEADPPGRRIIFRIDAPAR